MGCSHGSRTRAVEAAGAPGGLHTPEKAGKQGEATPTPCCLFPDAFQLSPNPSHAAAFAQGGLRISDNPLWNLLPYTPKVCFMNTLDVIELITLTIEVHYPWGTGGLRKQCIPF